MDRCTNLKRPIEQRIPTKCQQSEMPQNICGRDVILSESKKSPVGMGYVPWQTDKKMYEPCKAFEKGSAFVCLDLPFLGGRC